MKLDYYEKWKNLASSLADRSLEENKPEEAERLLWKTLLVNPQESAVRIKRLKALKSLNRWEEYRSEALFLSASPDAAFDLFKEALEHFPDEVNFLQRAVTLAAAAGDDNAVESLYQSLAKLYLDKSLPLKAVEMFERLMTFLPGQFQYHRNIAEIFLGESILDQSSRHYFVLAQHYLEARRIPEAAVPLEQILTFDPMNGEAVFLLARVYLEQSKIAEASDIIQAQMNRLIDEKHLDAAVRLSNQFIEILSKFNYPDQAGAEQERLAAVLFSHERQEEAIALMTRVAERELSKGNAAKYLELMRKGLDFYIEFGNLGRMIEFYEKMIAAVAGLDSTEAKLILNEFIQALTGKKKIAELDLSLRGLSKQLRERNDVVFAGEILIQLAEVYVSFYRIREAIELYETLTRVDDKKPELYGRLAELYWQEENLPQGVDAYLKAIEIYIHENREKKADEIFALVREKDPANPVIPGRLGQLFYALGDWDKALHFYEIALELDSSYRQAVLGTAMAYAKKGMLDDMVALAKRLANRGFAAEIVEEYRKALTTILAPDDIDLPLGLVYKDLGFMEEAVSEFQKAAKNPKHFLEASNQLGLCFKAQGFTDQAIRQYRKILDNAEFAEEETLEMRYNLAAIYEDVKMIREARELYNDILMFDIDYKDVKSRLKNLRGKESGNVVSLPPGDKP